MNYDHFRYAATQREKERISIYLLKSQPVPETVPIELQDNVAQDEWIRRLNEIKRVAFQFYKPMFERIWYIVAFISVLVVPMVLNRIIFNAVTKGTDRDDISIEQIYKARTISFSVFIGMLVVLWGPLIVWKMIGKQKIRNLINHWALMDEQLRGTSHHIPVWSVNTPSVFRSTTLVQVSIPPNARPSNFHPDAYLPNYINAPRDAGGAYYYPYGPNQQGIPRMSVIGNISDSKDYNGGLPAYHVGEYKGGYSDVKI